MAWLVGTRRNVALSATPDQHLCARAQDASAALPQRVCLYRRHGKSAGARVTETGWVTTLAVPSVQVSARQRGTTRQPPAPRRRLYGPTTMAKVTVGHALGLSNVDIERRGGPVCERRIPLTAVSLTSVSAAISALQGRRKAAILGVRRRTGCRVVSVHVAASDRVVGPRRDSSGGGRGGNRTSTHAACSAGRSTRGAHGQQAQRPGQGQGAGADTSYVTVVGTQAQVRNTS